jgi:N-acetylglutamate synthase-like GNAT family acetyltransferase/catechol 2,3-dioxygenase-like lactoylglutathione lyase family enzyme
MRISVRPARNDEAGELSALALRSKAQWGYDAQFLEACRAQLTLDPDELGRRRATVAEESGRVVGFYTLDGAPPEGELGNLWIEPSYMRRGIGRILWDHAMRVASDVGFAEVLIEAEPNAEGFYRAMGAERIGVVPSPIIPDRMLPRMRFRPPADTQRMALEFAGIAVDVAVTDLDRAEEFYTTLMGRRFDLRARPDQREWRLHADPEVVLRITADPAHAGHATSAIGVRDLDEEHARLAQHWPDLPPVQRKPGVIALLRLADPDRNTVVLWQDLLGRRESRPPETRP